MPYAPHEADDTLTLPGATFLYTFCCVRTVPPVPLEQCQDAILALTACHEDHPLTKFLGACNAAKAALDLCLANEYLIRREMNSAAAAESNARLRERHRLENEEHSM